MLTPKPLNTQLSGFLLVCWFSSPFQESLNLIVCQQYGFFSVLAAIIRESSDKKLVLRIVKPLPIVYQLDRVAPKARESGECQQLIGYINTRKNTIFFHVCCYGFSQGRKSLYNTTVYVINILSKATSRLTF